MARAKLRIRWASLLAAVLFVVAALIRPDVAIGLVVLGAIFIPLERRWPVTPSPAFRQGWSADVVHFVADQVFAAAIVVLLAKLFVPPLETILPDIDAYLSGIQIIVIAAVVGEVLGYWGHRAMHQIPFLWRLHSVHHSAPTMDWLAPNRRHVLDTALGQSAAAIPLLALGLSPPMLVSAFVLRRAQGLFVHANLRFHFPGLRWLIATPEFHHWHHSADPKYFNTNFAGQCPIVDRLFGTLHMPKREWPSSYGIPSAHSMPASYVGRLTFPFRRMASRRRSRSSIRARAAVCGAVAAVGFVTLPTTRATIPSGTQRTCVFPKGFSTGHPNVARIDIANDTVLLTDFDGKSAHVNVRRIHATTSNGLGIRVIRDTGAPLTINVDGTASGSDRRTAAEIRGSDGSAVGTC